MLDFATWMRLSPAPWVYWERMLPRGPDLLSISVQWDKCPKREVFWNTEVLIEATIQWKMSSWEELNSLDYEGVRTQETGCAFPLEVPFPILEPKPCQCQRKSLPRLKGKKDMRSFSCLCVASLKVLGAEMNGNKQVFLEYTEKVWKPNSASGIFNLLS